MHFDGARTRAVDVDADRTGARAQRELDTLEIAIANFDAQRVTATMTVDDEHARAPRAEPLHLERQVVFHFRSHDVAIGATDLYFEPGSVRRPGEATP